MKRRTFFQKALNLSLTFPIVCQPSTLTPVSKPLADSLSFQNDLDHFIHPLVRTCWLLLPHHSNLVKPEYLHFVQRCRTQLEQCLKHSSGSSFNAPLLSSLSELLQVEGWLLFTLRTPDQAEPLYKQALRLAEQAHNLEVQALALTWHSNFLIDTGRPSSASAFAEEAQKRAKKAAVSPCTQAWIQSTIADASAYQQQDRQAVHRCEYALDQADELMRSTDFEQDTIPSVPYDKIWFYGFRGAAYTHLGRSTEARLALEQGLRALAPTSYRRWGYHNDLILAHSLEGNLEAACASAHQALHLAQQAQAVMELQRTRDAAQRALQTWNSHPLVKNLFAEFQDTLH